MRNISETLERMLHHVICNIETYPADVWNELQDTLRCGIQSTLEDSIESKVGYEEHNERD